MKNKNSSLFDILGICTSQLYANWHQTNVSYFIFLTFCRRNIPFGSVYSQIYFKSINKNVKHPQKFNGPRVFSYRFDKTFTYLLNLYIYLSFLNLKTPLHWKRHFSCPFRYKICNLFVTRHNPIELHYNENAFKTYI